MALSDMHWKVPFQKTNIILFECKALGYTYIKKDRNWETKWRGKTIMSPVTQNIVVYNILCLSWDALITDSQGFQHDFLGLPWELLVCKNLQIVL